jgi:hypothetical protein
MTATIVIIKTTRKVGESRLSRNGDELGISFFSVNKMMNQHTTLTSIILDMITAASGGRLWAYVTDKYFTAPMIFSSFSLKMFSIPNA